LPENSGSEAEETMFFSGVAGDFMHPVRKHRAKITDIKIKNRCFISYLTLIVV
jgi:hypothetical protein